MAIIQYFIIVTDYGFNLSVTQNIAVNKDDKLYVSKKFWNVISCKLQLVILGGGLISLNGEMYSLRWILLASYIAVLVQQYFLYGSFKGKRLWDGLPSLT